ncbi:response regulator [Lysobacter lacus]|uniref:Response regulator n=2 Tax=Cognatilysobacter lacus TaxID=1643323 RepID=A0A5D8Z8A3_9GAMM|nr:response regulator [Lysobacter lacus]
MPCISGCDVARRLRESGTQVPLIALTGWGQATDREQALAAGFNRHLLKPVAIPLLLDLLSSRPSSAARPVERPG